MKYLQTFEDYEFYDEPGLNNGVPIEKAKEKREAKEKKKEKNKKYPIRKLGKSVKDIKQNI